MAKVQASQKPLPFVARELSRRLSADAHHRAVELLAQMLIDAVLAGRHRTESHDEREDPTDPS